MSLHRHRNEGRVPDASIAAFQVTRALGADWTGVPQAVPPRRNMCDVRPGLCAQWGARELDVDTSPTVAVEPRKAAAAVPDLATAATPIKTSAGPLLLAPYRSLALPQAYIQLPSLSRRSAAIFILYVASRLVVHLGKSQRKRPSDCTVCLFCSCAYYLDIYSIYSTGSDLTIFAVTDKPPHDINHEDSVHPPGRYGLRPRGPGPHGLYQLLRRRHARGMFTFPFLSSSVDMAESYPQLTHTPG
jgi:hypothetical protein